MSSKAARVSDEVHPEHKLIWDPSRKTYQCYVCKVKSNHAPSFICRPCNLHFHGDCATSLVNHYHPFYPKTNLQHGPMLSSADPQNDDRKVCTACNYLIHRTGYFHSNSTNNLYFHTCCAMLPESVPEMKMVLLQDAAGVSGCNVCGICHGGFNGGWVYLFEATGYCAHVWCVLVEQGHAITLVNTLPFESPTMSYRTIDWNQQCKIDLPQGIPVHEIQNWRPPNYYHGQYYGPHAGYSGNNYYHNPVNPVAYNQNYYHGHHPPVQGYSPAYNAAQQPPWPSPQQAPWPPSPQHGAVPWPPSPQHGVAWWRPSPQPGAAPWPPSPQHGAGPSTPRPSFGMFRTVLKWGFKIAFLAIGIAGLAGA